eukprot:scaffold27876_cov51-Attheya_sp.AAC.4
MPGMSKVAAASGPLEVYDAVAAHNDLQKCRMRAPTEYFRELLHFDRKVSLSTLNARTTTLSSNYPW